MALDPRVRTTLADFQRGRCDVETAAERLLEVRRDTGCLELHAAPDAPPSQRRLVERVAELVRQEFGSRPSALPEAILQKSQESA